MGELAMSMHEWSRRSLLKGSAIAGAAALAPSASPHAQTTKVLKARSYIDVAILDPGDRQGVVEEEIMSAIMGGLVRLKPGNEWTWEKDLAVSIEQADPTHIKFQLKPGIPWTNGFGEVTAEDVKFSYERIADPARKAEYRTDWDSLDHVEVTDARSGVIVMKRPFAPLWSSTLPTASGLILCKKAVESLPDKRIKLDPVAVCGPYQIKSAIPKRSLTLERNPLWPGAKPAFDEIQYIAILDANSAEIAYDAGEVDITLLANSAVPRLRKSMPAHSKLIVKPALAFWWIGMQSESGIFADKRLRQAMQYALDPQAVIEGAFFGVPERSTGVIAPGLIGHRPANMIKGPDLDKAKALLKEAGKPNGFKTTIGVRNSAEFVNGAQVLAAQLAQIGVTAEVIPYDTGSQKALADDKNGAWKKMEMHIIRFSMQPDPSWATAWFVTSQIGQWNWERFSNPEFDKLVDAGVAELDDKKRDAMYQRMQDLMEESGSYLFLTHGVNAVLHRDTIKPSLSPDAQRFQFRDFELA
jgi:peptide/nickel transport system substrate-binding protein